MHRCDLYSHSGVGCLVCEQQEILRRWVSVPFMWNKRCEAGAVQMIRAILRETAAERLRRKACGG